MNTYVVGTNGLLYQVVSVRTNTKTDQTEFLVFVVAKNKWEWMPSIFFKPQPIENK